MTPILIVDFQNFTITESAADLSKVVYGIYYRTKSGLIPIAYCFKASERESIEYTLQEMKAAKHAFTKAQYDTQVYLRKEYGV